MRTTSPRPRSQRDRLRRAVEVAGRAVPLLAFAAVHRQLDGVAVGAVERFRSCAAAPARGTRRPEAPTGTRAGSRARWRRTSGRRPAFRPSTSRPKICALDRLVPFTWKRGSRAASLETSSNNRPSSASFDRFDAMRTANSSGRLHRSTRGRHHGEEHSGENQGARGSRHSERSCLGRGLTPMAQVLCRWGQNPNSFSASRTCPARSS